uniref:Uncharacterized protein n=1 Tax=Pyrodinium bahamense TaxID=73915 RepID=A0A7R9ZV18_9DINO|mmetsp:Transcript_10469/g.29109  ORF Transcript_10469/g.29109 Transcript_10469/m.29109 type:complete len:332 (+) Transcript_10469:61-1056(+)
MRTLPCSLELGTAPRACRRVRVWRAAPALPLRVLAALLPAAAACALARAPWAAASFAARLWPAATAATAGARWRPQPPALARGAAWRLPRWAHTATPTRAAAAEKELDTDAVSKYLAAVALQMSMITAFFFALDAAVVSSGFQPPEWAIFGLFFGLSLRSRIFSPLDNSRPDIQKAMQGQSTGGFNDRTMPSWTPPGVFFPIMWILIVAPLRAASSVLVWQQVGHLCDLTLLALMLHLSIGDTWNTVNNVERRLGAAVPGVLCVWASALLAAYSYYQVLPLAGQVLLPTCVWLTVAAALVTDTWRINNASGEEPLFPYKGDARTQYWFLAK